MLAAGQLIATPDWKRSQGHTASLLRFLSA